MDELLGGEIPLFSLPFLHRIYRRCMSHHLTEGEAALNLHWAHGSNLSLVRSKWLDCKVNCWWLTHFPSPPAPFSPKIKQFSCVMNCICYQVAWKLTGPKHLQSPCFSFGIMMSFVAIPLICVFQGCGKEWCKNEWNQRTIWYIGDRLQLILNDWRNSFLASGLSNSLHQTFLSGWLPLGQFCPDWHWNENNIDMPFQRNKGLLCNQQQPSNVGYGGLIHACDITEVRSKFLRQIKI